MTKQDFLDLFNKEAGFEAKARLYRQLAVQHHPDKGGDLEAMKALNLAFEDVRRSVDKESGADMSAVEAMLREIETFLRDLGLGYEITGSWVWVESTDKTIAHKEALKQRGFRWASQKKRWYYAGVPTASKGGYDMDRIREKYGSRSYEAQREKELSQ